MNLARLVPLEALDRTPPLRRRGFLALGAGGIGTAVALAGCGEEIEEPSSERDLELLSQALASEENTATALGSAAPAADHPELVESLGRQASQAAARLQATISQIGDAPAEGEFEAPAGRNDAALRAAAGHTNEAVAAHARGAGQLSEETLRREAIELAALAGARAAILAELLGEEPARYAFVTGGERAPYQSADIDGGDEEEPTAGGDGDSEASAAEEGP